MTVGTDELNIDTGKLAQAESKATATAAASAPATLASPPTTASSLMDAALVVLSTAIDAQRVTADTRDTAWTTKQAAALTQSPPVLIEGDENMAHEIQGIPIPITLPPHTGKVWTT